jgi:protein-S-isoprenylcysteine O-methyltransferase Ste14
MSTVQANIPAAGTAWRTVRSLLRPIAGMLWIGTMFLGAGRLDWVRGWIYAAMWAIGMSAVGIVVNHYNPSIMAARAQLHPKETKRFDKIFWAAYFPLVLLQPAVAGLDAVRFRWSSLPFGVVYVGVLAFILALTLIAWVLCVNPFAEATVRIQTDRGQTVVTSGPYRVVRHPMYVGAFLWFLGAPLVWGSLWALIIGIVIVVLMIWRTSREDQTLRQELCGYEQYAAVTRYRLLPGVW